jgi:hypothetical protein
MSKSNDPSGTAMKVVEHPRFAWLIRKTAVLLTIIQYRMSASLHLRFKGLKNYRLFRYEDLLAEPEKVLRELCEFIEVDFKEEMLQPQRGQHEHQPSSLTGERRKAFDARAGVRWRTVISRIDYWLISCLTEKSMKKFGYDPKTHPIFEKAKESQLVKRRQAVS